MWAWHGRGTYVRAALLSETNKAAARRQTILKLCGYLSSAPSSACLLLPLAATPLPPISPSLPGTTAAAADKQSAPGGILKSTYQSYPKSEPKAGYSCCKGVGHMLGLEVARGRGAKLRMSLAAFWQVRKILTGVGSPNEASASSRRLPRHNLINQYFISSTA